MDVNQNFSELYIKWIRENIKIKTLRTDLGEFTQISTPFLDRHNDHIQIYVQKEESGLLLTDAGYSINDLEMCGCDIMASQRRKNVLLMILNGFGVQVEKNQICVRANYANFAQKKHALVQAILSVNDMFFLSRSQVANVFIEDVQMFFDANNVRYISNAQFTGESGLLHSYEFTIASSKNKPERFVRTINDVSREKIDSVLFSWGDIKDLRKQGAQLYVIMNDSEKIVRPDLSNALKAYGGKPILWSEREQHVTDLAS